MSAAVEFDGDAEKWSFLQAAPYADARDPRIHALARHLLGAARSVRVFAHLAHSLARDGLRYQTDMKRVGREDIAPVYGAAARSLYEDYLRGVEDCDGKARLFCALCLAAGIDARMVPRWEAGRLVHVSAEVKLSGEWLPVELTIARARIGDLAEDVPFERNGRWLRP